MLFSKIPLLCAGLGPSTFVAASLMQPREASLEVTGVSYKGSGCPQGSLTGMFEPSTNSFNVTIKELKAELGKLTDSLIHFCALLIHVGCHREGQGRRSFALPY